MMKATEFESGDIISDGDDIRKLFEKHGEVYVRSVYGGETLLKHLTGDNWHRLIPECVLTEADRVTDLDTLVEGDFVIIKRQGCEPFFRPWCAGFYLGTNGAVYRDPRPLPRIIPAKEKTLEEKVAEMIHDWAFSDPSLQTTKIATEIVAMLKGGTP